MPLGVLVLCRACAPVRQTSAALRTQDKLAPFVVFFIHDIHVFGRFYRTVVLVYTSILRDSRPDASTVQRLDLFRAGSLSPSLASIQHTWRPSTGVFCRAKRCPPTTAPPWPRFLFDPNARGVMFHVSSLAPARPPSPPRAPPCSPLATDTRLFCPRGLRRSLHP